MNNPCTKEVTKVLIIPDMKSWNCGYLKIPYQIDLEKY